MTMDAVQRNRAIVRRVVYNSIVFVRNDKCDKHAFMWFAVNLKQRVSKSTALARYALIYLLKCIVISVVSLTMANF